MSGAQRAQCARAAPRRARQALPSPASSRPCALAHSLAHSLAPTRAAPRRAAPAPQANDLKKRIESLIDREYLERDLNDTSVYNYVA